MKVTFLVVVIFRFKHKNVKQNQEKFLVKIILDPKNLEYWGKNILGCKEFRFKQIVGPKNLLVINIIGSKMF